MATKKRLIKRAGTKTVSARKPVKKKATRKQATKKVVKRVGAKKRAVAKKPAKRKSIKKTIKRMTPKRRPKKRVAKQVKKKPTKRAISAIKRSKDTAFLEAFVGSSVRARLLRLVYRQPNVSHELQDASKDIGMPLPQARREAEALAQMGIVTVSSRGGKKRIQASSTFPYLRELEQLATSSFPISRDELLKILKSAGALKMVVVAGVFLNDGKSQTDLLVVTGKYSEKRLERAITRVEQAIASELRWAGMDAKEFKYRWRMFDRFVRDVLTNEHERVLDSIRPK